MRMQLVYNQKVVLAHWTYNEVEWKNFLKWKKLCESWLHLVAFYLIIKKKVDVPEITITTQKVWIGDQAETFNDTDRQLKNVLITEIGKLNVLIISYVVLKEGRKTYCEIKIPVPFRKLREAIQLSERLMVSQLP